jgi:hypothetical protein
MFKRDELYLFKLNYTHSLLNNLESSFNAFTTAKQQTIYVYISFFDALMTELIDESQIDSTKFFIVMAFVIITSHFLNNVLIVKEQIMKNSCAEINICIRRRNLR